MSEVLLRIVRPRCAPCVRMDTNAGGETGDRPWARGCVLVRAPPNLGTVLRTGDQLAGWALTEYPYSFIFLEHLGFLLSFATQLPVVFDGLCRQYCRCHFRALQASTGSSSPKGLVWVKAGFDGM